MTEEQLWALFHNLWTRDVGTAGYDKEKWKWLEAAVKRLVKLDSEKRAEPPPHDARLAVLEYQMKDVLRRGIDAYGTELGGGREKPIQEARK